MENLHTVPLLRRFTFDSGQGRHSWVGALADTLTPWLLSSSSFWGEGGVTFQGPFLPKAGWMYIVDLRTLIFVNMKQYLRKCLLVESDSVEVLKISELKNLSMACCMQHNYFLLVRSARMPLIVPPLVHHRLQQPAEISSKNWKAKKEKRNHNLESQQKIKE